MNLPNITPNWKYYDYWKPVEAGEVEPDEWQTALKETKMYIKLTRRSKVGFGYNAGCSQHWNNAMTHSWLAPDETTSPTHTGTVLQVRKANGEDRTLASYSQGTAYTTAWFAKVGREWKRLKIYDENFYEFYRLTNQYPDPYTGVLRYEADEVTVEVED